MKLNDAFPSNFLKAEDLAGRTVPCTITSVVMETIGQGRDAEDKVVITFAGKQKKFICNKTNFNTIAKLYGDETDDWTGKVIQIAPREVEYQGDQVWAIRVVTPAPGNSAAKPIARPARPSPSKTAEKLPYEPADNDGDGEVPF